MVRTSLTDVVDEFGVPWTGLADCCGVPWEAVELVVESFDESFFLEDLFESLARDNCSC